MYGQIDGERELRLIELFGSRSGIDFDEETEANMAVRLDVRQFDRIVAIGFEDPTLVAN